MFIGHFAAALAAKKIIPRVNLAVSFIACQFLDLIWPIFVFLGIERVSVDGLAKGLTPLDFEYYPYSHGLFMTLIYSALFGVFFGVYYKSRKAGLVLAILVISHWFFDFLTHRKDLVLFFEGKKWGLGLWNYPLLSMSLEFLLFLIGVVYYVKSVDFKFLYQKITFGGLILCLLLVFVSNFFATPPNHEAASLTLAKPILGLWIFIVWAYCADRITMNSFYKKVDK